MIEWKKYGNIFNPLEIKTESWMEEYAQLPFPFPINDDKLRVYFATRPKPDSGLQYVSRSGYVDILQNDFKKVVNISSNPIIDLGGSGTFDEFGCMTSSFIKHNNQVYAYYTGWTRMETVPYTMAIGMAISNDGGTTFSKYSDGPILGITAKEPYLISGPVVKIIDEKWHMWYLTGTKWLNDNGKYEPVYKIAHATSTNGIDWDRDGKPVLPSLNPDECQVSFALFYNNNKWNVIFAYRKPLDFRENNKNAYRLGYAYSDDLENWERDDAQINLPVSENGWDSEMIAYPQVLELNGEVYLFYCGNNFGKSGFGVSKMIFS